MSDFSPVFCRAICNTKIISVLIVTIFLSVSTAKAQSYFHHDLTVNFEPDNQQLKATDTITIPADRQRSRFLTFKLHASLQIMQIAGNVSVKLVDNAISTFEINRVPLKTYQLTLGNDQVNQFTIKYQGMINSSKNEFTHTLDNADEHMSDSIDNDGIWLSGNSRWYPDFGDELMTYNLSATLPDDWTGISQGLSQILPQHQENKIAWRIASPADGIILIAGQYETYTRDSERTYISIYQSDADAVVANRYLDLAENYLHMYSTLIGEYPYRQFSLITTNKNITAALPSIAIIDLNKLDQAETINSLFPHFLLHNWWGNAVFGSEQFGNWQESLITYLTDHLIAEQRSKGRDQRQKALYQFANHVSLDQDFPLSMFRSLFSEHSRAVGLAKGQLVWHMLRLHLGDAAFVEGLRQLFKQQLYKKTSYEDIRYIFEQVSMQKLDKFFQQWVFRAGSPEIHLTDIKTTKNESGYEISFTVEQKQDGFDFELQLPVVIQTRKDPNVEDSSVEDSNIKKISAEHSSIKDNLFWLTLNKRQVKASFSVKDKPLTILPDPGFDIFRRINNQPLAYQLQSSNPVIVKTVTPDIASTLRHASQHLPALVSMPKRFSEKRFSTIKNMLTAINNRSTLTGNSNSDIIRYLTLSFEKARLMSLSGLQSWKQPVPGAIANTTITQQNDVNIIGMIPGVKPFNKNSIIISSWYDASGKQQADPAALALLIELAHTFNSMQPNYNLIFVALSAKQQELALASFIDNPHINEVGGIIAHLHLTTDDSQHSSPMTLSNLASSPNWPTLVNDVAEETDIFLKTFDTIDNNDLTHQISSNRQIPMIKIALTNSETMGKNKPEQVSQNTSNIIYFNKRFIERLMYRNHPVQFATSHPDTQHHSTKRHY